MTIRPSTPEIITVNSEALETQIRDLLPSQNGFGSELQASNVITPIIDLTAAAEGSGLATDLARAIAFGSQTAFKSVIAAQAAALLCWRALDNGDRVGGLVFSDNASALIRPRRSRLSALHLLNKITEYNQCIKNFSLESRYDNSSGLSPSLSSALSGIRRITKPGSTLYVYLALLTSIN